MARKPVNTAQFSLRIPKKMKDDLQIAAEKQGIDGVVWIRHAIQEKLDREKNNQGPDTMSNEVLEALIERVLNEKLAEKRSKK